MLCGLPLLGTADMSELHQAICAKFELSDTSKLRLYLTEDKIEVGCDCCEETGT